MRTTRGALALGLSLAFRLGAAPPPPQAPAPAPHPHLEVEAPTFDFGEIDPDSKVTHRFRIDNAGDAPLALEEPQPSCGCTSSLLGQSVLAPGESTGLDVTFHAGMAGGHASKTVTLPSNDPDQPRKTLVFTAEVRPGVVASQEDLYFLDLGRKDRRKATVTLRIGTGAEVRLDRLERPGAPWLGIATRPAGTALQAEFRLRADRLPPDRLSGTDTVRFHLAGLKPEAVPVAVHWELLPPVRVRPRHALLRGGPGQDRVATVRLDHTQRTPFRILGVVASDPRLQVTGASAGPAARQQVEVRLAAPDVKEDFQGRVYLTLDLPDHPEVVIPVTVARP